MFVYFDKHLSRTIDHAQNLDKLERDLRTFNKKSRREHAIDFNADIFKKNQMNTSIIRRRLAIERS